MNFLGRIPFWAWYLFSVAFCYWLWNPYVSVGHFMVSNADVSIKAIMLVLTLCIAAVYIIEGHRTLNVIGVVLFVALFGTIFWFAFRNGVQDFAFMKWFGQWIVGLLLAFAVQGNKIYRQLFGVVTVAGGPDDSIGHHHS